MNGNRPTTASSTKGAPEGVEGCDKCEYGLRGEVEKGRKTSLPLYLVRVYQAKWGMIKFCPCPAGLAYRKYLHRVWDRIEEGKEGSEVDVSVLSARIFQELETVGVAIPTVKMPLAMSPFDVAPPPPPDIDDYVPTVHYDEVEVIAA
jgi:hypothetical protein